MEKKKWDTDLLNFEANARRICHCVNNFDELLAACKCLLADLEGSVELLNFDEVPEHIKQSVVDGRLAIANTEK